MVVECVQNMTVEKVRRYWFYRHYTRVLIICGSWCGFLIDVISIHNILLLSTNSKVMDMFLACRNTTKNDTY
jgi:hypothetical protein